MNTTQSKSILPKWVVILPALSCFSLSAPVLANNTSYAINVGGQAFTAQDGTQYSEDQYHIDGSTYSTSAEIQNTENDELYQSERWGAQFAYELPVPNGTYDVTLKFAEIYFDAKNKRSFSVQVEDNAVSNGLDVFTESGGKNNAHDVTTRNVVVEDGALSLSLSALIDNAKLSAIKVTPKVAYHDIAVAYTNAALNAAGGDVARIEREAIEQVEYSNLVYQNSGVNIQLRLVDIFKAEDQGSDEFVIPHALQDETDGILDNVTEFRETHGVDIIGIIGVSNQITVRAGIGHAYGGFLTDGNMPYFGVNYGEHPNVFTHELGHVQGLLHSRSPSFAGFSGEYNYGFAAQLPSGEVVGTVMQGSTNPIPYFSSPGLTYEGVSLGIDPASDPNNGAWSVRSLNENALEIEAWRTPKLATASDLRAAEVRTSQVKLEWQDNAKREKLYEISVRDAEGNTVNRFLTDAIKDTLSNGRFGGSSTHQATIHGLRANSYYIVSVRPWATGTEISDTDFSIPVVFTTKDVDSSPGFISPGSGKKESLVPGVVEAEHFTNYNDSTKGNSGGAYRTTDVDLVEDSSNASINVTSIEAGEWLEFAFEVEQTGLYKGGLRVKPEQNTPVSFQFADAKGEPITPVTSISVQGLNAGQWNYVQFPVGELVEGNLYGRLVFITGGYSVDSIEFARDFGGDILEAENFTDSSNVTIENTNDENDASEKGFIRGAPIFGFPDTHTTEWENIELGLGEHELSFRVKSLDGSSNDVRIIISGPSGLVLNTVLESSSNNWEEISVPVVDITEAGLYRISYNTRRGLRSKPVPDLDFIRIRSLDAPEPEPNLHPEQNLHPDIVTVLDRTLDEIPYAPDPIWWGDSYSVGDQCYCDSAYDHGAGDIVVETQNGTMTVLEACELIGPGPGPDGHPRYNDVQCGNGPVNGTFDEDFCPGQINVEGTDEERRLGCNNIGPTWKLPAGTSGEEQTEDGNLHPDIVTVLDRTLDEIPYAPDPIWWGDSYSVGDQCYCDSTYDHDAGDIVVETENGTMNVREACELIGPGPGPDGNPRYNDVQCGNGPVNGMFDEDFCPGQINVEGTDEERRLGCNNIGPTWKLPVL